MKPELLLQHFNRISEAPEAIPRLRRFILDLAVRGKLVEQDSADEPASELLKRIQAEKERLVKEGIIKKIELSSILSKEDNLYFVVPQTWVFTCLGDIARYGVSDKVDSNAAISKDTWVLDLEDIEKDTSQLLDRVMSSNRHFQSTKTVFKRNDVLFGKLRPYLNKVIVADTDGVCTTEIVPIRGYCGMVPEYIRLVLKSPLTMERVDRLMYGMKMPRLGTNDAITLISPLPPLAEQQRIVAKVDELMALCDQLEAERNQRETHRDKLVAASLRQLQSQDHLTRRRGDAEKGKKDSDSLRASAPPRDPIFLQNFQRLTTKPEHIKQLRQTILDLAVRGKLVEQDSNDEPAAELLKKIAKEKIKLVDAGEIRKQKAFSAVNAEEKHFDCPNGWEWCRLQEIVYILGDGLHGTPEYTLDEGYYFINGNNLSNGKIAIKSDTKTVAEDQYVKYRKQLSNNSVLVSINGTLGNVAFYNNEEIILGKSACFFNLAETIYKRFIKIVIDAPSFKVYAYANATGTTIKNLGLSAMNSLPIAIPPLAEQHRIVAKVDELMALCDQLETQLTTTAADSRRLLEAVLRDALDGDTNQIKKRSLL